MIMKRHTWLVVFLLLIVILACDFQSAPIATPTFTLTDTLTPVSTPTPTITITSTPTRTQTSIPTLAITASSNEVTLSVHFEQPVVLNDSQVRVTVMGISNAGDSVGEFPSPYIISIADEYKDSRYLLQLSLAIENLTDKVLEFGTSSMVIRLENNELLVLAGGCDSNFSCGGGFTSYMPEYHTTNLYLIFNVPNEIEQFTLFLLGATPVVTVTPET